VKPRVAAASGCLACMASSLGPVDGCSMRKDPTQRVREARRRRGALGGDSMLEKLGAAWARLGEWLWFPMDGEL
jgi:hypothetical protein